MLPETLTLEVVTPERELVREQVHEVQLRARQGYLGILPGHAPLLTDLGIGLLTWRKGNTVERLSIINGYAEVLPDRVIVLAETGERAEEIDLVRARAAFERASKRLSQTAATEIDWQRALLALERARVRMDVASIGGSVEDHE